MRPRLLSRWPSFGSRHRGPTLTPYFSFVRRSIIAGAKNNIFGMVGFVREGRKSQNRFDERLDGEAEIKKIAAAKKAAKAKAAAGKQ